MRERKPQAEKYLQSKRSNHMKARLILFSVLVTGLLLTAVFAHWLCPYDPNQQNLDMALQAPSLDHLLGTDRFGRDMLSRVIMGSRTSICWG